MIDNGYRNFGEGFNTYLKSIENIPLLSEEQEKELSAVILGNQDGVNEAIEKLVVSNLLLVVKFAINYFKFINKGNFEISIMDLISEGNMALFKAASTFDSEKGKFSTYASHYIKRYLQNSHYNNRFIRLPVNYFTIVNMAKKLMKEKDELSNEDIHEISIAQSVSEDHVKFILECYRKKVISIDQPSELTSYDGDEATNDFIDNYLSDEKSLDVLIMAQEDSDYLHKKIESLTEMEQKVIYAKFFSDNGSTCQDLAKSCNVSKQRISQILIGALKKLKKRIKEDNSFNKNNC